VQDRASDEAKFRRENHLHITALETVEMVPMPGRPVLRGWRLWCMNCDLRGDLVLADRTEAMAFADSLRSVAEPPCEHYRAAEGQLP
jgi:hypothetical protein